MKCSLGGGHFLFLITPRKIENRTFYVKEMLRFCFPDKSALISLKLRA